MKRTISLILAMILTVTSMPVQAFAGESETETVVRQQEDAITAAMSQETIAESIPEDTVALEEPLELDAAVAEAEAQAEDNYSGTCGDNLTWELDISTGMLTISGFGPMMDYKNPDDKYAFESDLAPWMNYAGDITAIILDNNVNTVGDYAFSECTELKTVTIPVSTKILGTSAFCYSAKLTDIYYSGTDEEWATLKKKAESGNTSLFQDTVTVHTNWGERVNSMSGTCGDDVVWFLDLDTGKMTISGSGEMDDYSVSHGGYVNDSLPKYTPWADVFRSIKSVTIEPGVTGIGTHAFENCLISEVTIPKTVTKINHYAFKYNDQLSKVNYGGSPEQWNNITIGVENGPLAEKTAAFHYNYDGSSPAKIEFQNLYPNFYVFRGDPEIYNMNYQTDSSYVKLSHIMSLADNGSPDDLVWTSSDESVLSITPTGNLVPDFVGHVSGTSTVTVTHAQGEMLSFPVTVLLCNELTLETVHDSRQFYYDGGFYSEESGFSDCVEIFLRFDNIETDKYPCQVPDASGSGVAIAPITVTATVDGENLSFERGTYKNTYTRTLDAIPLNSSLAELLMLFPRNNQALTPGEVYTVNVTMESDTFREPITSVHTFTICDAVLTTVGSHIQFVDGSNNNYHVSKGNPYRHMAGLKDDLEYKWSKWSSFDFENYYEVVIADLMIGVLNVQQEQNFTLMPKVLTEWTKNFTTLTKSIDKILKDEDETSDSANESEIEKIFKLSKYDLGVNNAELKKENGLYVKLMETFSKPEHQEKLHNVFRTIDNSKQIYKLISIPKDFYKEFRAWGNTITLMNAYSDADAELKEVVETVLKKIPQDADPKLREAIESYVSYDHDVTGQALEIFDAFLDTAAKVSYDTFKAVWGKSAAQYLGAKLLGFIGDISLKGGSKLAETAIFSTASKAFGAVSTGASIGFFISDLICDSKDKASEMGKVIAAADYAPYFVEALEEYEQMMLERNTLDSVRVFERAFQLHQAAQSYLVEHVYNLLIVKAESLVQIIRGNDEYYDVAGEALVYKNKVDNLRCCAPSTMDSATIRTARHIAIKCPVDVFVYDVNGTEIVRIRSNELEYAADGITVCIIDSEKHIIVPEDQVYTVKIEATDSGTMDYVITEYGDDLTVDRTRLIEGIPLTKNQEFNADLPETTQTDPQDYTLTSGSQNYTFEHDHKWDEGTVTREPTATEPGLITYTCENCGETKTAVISSVQRIAGTSRVDTALEVAKTLKETLGVEKLDAVIIASGEDKSFADALTGSYLANKKGAPILLYRNTGMSELNLEFIKNNLSSDGTVYLLGDTSVVPASVEESLAQYKVKRLAGISRFDTNLAILKEAGVDDEEILIVRGFDFADSLSASATGLPILLVNEVLETLTDTQLEFLESLDGNKLTIIGGTLAISEELEAKIEAVAETDVERVFGGSREETSVEIAKRYFTEPTFALVAYSRKCPDGLCGGPLAYAKKAPLLLTNTRKEAVANTYITDNDIEAGYVLGGTTVVSDETAKLVFGMSEDAVLGTK